MSTAKARAREESAQLRQALGTLRASAGRLSEVRSVVGGGWGFPTQGGGVA